QVYPLRISAVYAIYDPSRRNSFRDELNAAAKEIAQDLRVIENVPEFRSDVQKVNTAIRGYIDFSNRAVSILDRRDRHEVTEQEFAQFLSQYREIGNSMVHDINSLSLHVNEFATKQLADSNAKNQSLMNTATIAILVVFIASIAVAWWLSGLI
ncbi:methyl-accepting chemotaxis protein, partial [Photobacterium damselae]